MSIDKDNFLFSLVKTVSNNEAYSIVILIEVGVVLSHEGISKNEVLEVVWEDLAHHSNYTLSLTSFSDLKNVVRGWEGIVNAFDLECNLWKVPKVRAIRIHNYSLY